MSIVKQGVKLNKKSAGMGLVPLVISASERRINLYLCIESSSFDAVNKIRYRGNMKDDEG